MTLIEPVGNSTFHSLQATSSAASPRDFGALELEVVEIHRRRVGQQGHRRAHANPKDMKFDKGPSDFDHARRLHALQPVRAAGEVRAACDGNLLGGWNLTGIVTLQSGFPFTIGSGVDNARTGTGGQRADLIGDPYLSGDRSRADRIAEWLNHTAFAPNALGTFGNQGRNMFRGPGLAVIDLGLHKNFRITERVNTQFRFETFNALNRVNLNGPE